MGSIFTTLPDDFNIKDITGKIFKYPQYIQFQPGVVVQVVHGEDSDGFDNTGIGTSEQTGKSDKVGSIIAHPYYSDRGGVIRRSMLGERFRYWPLMRGMQDIPTINDPVLLCTFGGVNYYMGPLNTQGQVNFNADTKGNDQTPLPENAAKNNMSLIKDPHFHQQRRARLQKKVNKSLDDPLRPREAMGNAYAHTVGSGDLMLEGRHGNSIRIGSRNINPYIYISNGRGNDNIVESTLDSSLFALIQRGTIREHFPYDTKYKDLQGETIEEEGASSYPFQLADGDNTEIEPDKIYSSISKTFAQPLGHGDVFDGPSIDSNPVIYEYSGSHAFLTSDRVTINAKPHSEYNSLETGQLAGCMYLSSANYMHFGSGNTITFSTSNNMLMNVSRDTTINSTTEFNVNCKTANVDGSERINLGDPLKGDIMQPVAKGTDLVWMLKQLASDCMSLCDRTAAAIEGSADRGASIGIMGDMKKTFKNWQDEIDVVLSKKVYTK